MTQIAVVLRRTPLTAVLCLGILSSVLLHGSLHHDMSADRLDALGFGIQDLPRHPERLLQAPFLILRPYMLASIALIVLVFVGGCEVRLGTRWALLAFAAGHVLGYVGAPSLAWLLSQGGLAGLEPLVHQRDVGASNGAFGAAGALGAALPGFAGAVVVAVLLLYLVVALVLEFHIWDIAHLIAFGSGITIGALYARRQGRSWIDLGAHTILEARHRPQVVAWLIGSMGTVNIVTSFALAHHAAAAGLLRLVPFDNPHWPRHAFFVSGVLLLILSRGLARGQQRSWWLSVGVLAAITLVSAGLDILHPRALASALVLGVLILWKRSFRAHAARASGFVRTASATLVTTVAIVTLGTLALRHGFTDRLSFMTVLREIGLQLTLSSDHALHATDERTRWFLELLPFVMFGSVGLLLVSLVRSVKPTPRSQTDEQRARDILAEHGSTGTSYMTLWPHNQLFLASDGRSYVAYRVHGDMAVALGDPVGPVGSFPNTIATFRDHCRSQGWAHVFYGTTAASLRSLTEAAYDLLKVGEEAMIPLPSLAFKGKEWQAMRSAMNRATKQNVSFAMYEGGQVPVSIRGQLDEIYEAVSRSRALPPMEFTLGKPSDVDDPNINVAVAVDADGRVHGYVDWLPIATKRGWVIDLMMRRAESMSNVMDFLIARSLLEFQRRGYAFASLAAAPLADVDRDSNESKTIVQHVIAQMFNRFDTYYDFRSLFAFKSKFQPVWEPVYLAYEGIGELPRAAIAILYAHLPGLDSGMILGMLGSTLRDRLNQARLHAPETAPAPPAASPMSRCGTRSRPT